MASSPSVVRLESVSGTTVDILSTGAAIQRLIVPDRNGILKDIVLGFDDLDMYKHSENPYFGGIVGRVANRIAGGQFELEGKTYTLAKNNGPNCLHGGLVGWNRVEWKEVARGSAMSAQGSVEYVAFEYQSPSMEESFPGSVTAKVTYSLSRDGSKLSVDMEARVHGAQTLMNMAQHSYFNLGGHDSPETILDHELQILADHFTPLDDEQIPTGEICPVQDVEGMDFTAPHLVGSRIESVPGGYDHNYVLFGLGQNPKDKTSEIGMACEDPKLAAVLYHPKSGRGMNVLTTAPGVQFYSGNFLDGSLEGKQGIEYQKHSGLCLETQGFPDAIHHPNFPSIVIKPGQVYKHAMRYEFWVSQ